MNNKTIILPENSFWKVFKRFGRDEVISMVFNIIGAVLIFKILSNYFEETNKVFLILVSLGGPIIEKIGFYPAHFYDAYKKYKLNKSDGYWKHLKQAIKNGSVSLLEDILIHDPIYVLLMFFGLKLYSETPVWMLSFLSFFIAVIIVSFLEVYFFEIWFKLFKTNLIKKGYKKDSYYESRFIVNNDDSIIKPVAYLCEHYDLILEENEILYSDLYYDNKLIEFNGRVPSMRTRLIGDNNKYEIIYTKSGELKPTDLHQYRFFINKREKYTIEKCPGHFNKLKDKKGSSNTISFLRKMYRKEGGLFLTVDRVNDNYCVIEVKVHEDKYLLMDAMTYLMNNCNLTMTTHGKNNI